MRGKDWTDSWKRGRDGSPPQSQATESLPPSESAHTSTPWPRLLIPWQGLISTGPEYGAIAFPQADVIQSRVFLPRNMTTAVLANGSA